MHIEVLEMCDLDAFVQQVTTQQTEQVDTEMREIFKISEGFSSDSLEKKPTEEQLQWACKISDRTPCKHIK